MPMQSKNKSILLVDDEPMLLDVMVTVLEAGGYKCITAGAGLEAIETYRQNQDQIAAVVLDLGLPDYLGQDVFAAMRQINPNARIIVASGAIDPDVQNELTRAGCKHFVEKPYNIAELLQALKTPSA